MSDLWFTDTQFEKLTKAREKRGATGLIKEAKTVRGFGRVPSRTILGRYIADKTIRNREGMRKMVLRFPGKTWQISMKSKEEANVFGKVLAGASHAGMWFPHKRNLTGWEVANTTYPNKQGVWWYLIWDATGKTFVIQKYHYGKDDVLEPTNEAKAVDAIDYYSDAFSSSFEHRSLRLRRTRSVRDIKENPFALLSLIGRNIHKTGGKTPNLDYERNVMSWNERLEPFLKSDGPQRENLYAQAKKRGKKWVVNVGG